MALKQVLYFRKKVDNRFFSLLIFRLPVSVYKRKADGRTGFTSVTIKVLTLL